MTTLQFFAFLFVAFKCTVAIAIVLLALFLLPDMFEALWGRFGRFTSPLVLRKKYVVSHCNVYVVAFRPNRERSEGRLSQAYDETKVVHAEEDLVEDLRMMPGLLPVTMSSRVAKGKVLTIHPTTVLVDDPANKEAKKAIREMERSSKLLFASDSHFICMDACCASNKTQSHRFDERLQSQTA